MTVELNASFAPEITPCRSSTVRGRPSRAAFGTEPDPSGVVALSSTTFPSMTETVSTMPAQKHCWVIVSWYSPALADDAAHAARAESSESTAWGFAVPDGLPVPPDPPGAVCVPQPASTRAPAARRPGRVARRSTLIGDRFMAAPSAGTAAVGPVAAVTALTAGRFPLRRR